MQVQHPQWIDPLPLPLRVAILLDQVARHPHPGTIHADQLVMHVAAGGIASAALEPDGHPPAHLVPDLDQGLLQVDVHAAVAVAVVDDDHDGLHVQAVSPPDLAVEIVERAAEADGVGETPADRHDHARVGRPDRVTTEGRGVQTRMDALTIDDQEAVIAGSEEVGHAALVERPGVPLEVLRFIRCRRCGRGPGTCVERCHRCLRARAGHCQPDGRWESRRGQRSGGVPDALGSPEAAASPEAAGAADEHRIACRARSSRPGGSTYASPGVVTPEGMGTLPDRRAAVAAGTTVGSGRSTWARDLGRFAACRCLRAQRGVIAAGCQQQSQGDDDDREDGHGSGGE